MEKLSSRKLVPCAQKVGDLLSRRWKRGASGLKSGQWMKLSDLLRASQVVLVVKNPPTNAGNIGDAGSIPVLLLNKVIHLTDWQ